MKIFNEVDRFFSSLNNYITHNEIFIIFVGLFLLALVIVFISTSNSYEAKLIKAIDMFNHYFVANPQITEDNLISFNNRMKTSKVPKQLRKQWQQFVLYRENVASHYMSYSQCVETPIRTSTYKRDIHIMNVVSYILASLCLILNLYSTFVIDITQVLQQALLAPMLILLLNYFVTIFLTLRHNAIVSDLNQSYQFFEVNIDKATTTIPEYVDYEVLFDKNEIKKGIPILYAYLQKRAEEEQKELERARLRNVEHEKYNFDAAGLESSLVLERAMQEAENYIAERKKYMQDIEQINNEITQEEMNFREITKEYQRQMQVSKETFENFKAQLSEVTSTIETNYLKKQQQQELDRQRNLERDYDTATDRHKKILATLHTDLKSVENEIKEARISLEKSMMSEFESYSDKVYKEVYNVVEEREYEKLEKVEFEKQQLEEKIIAKEEELDNIYTQYQIQLEKLEQLKLSQQQQEIDNSNNYIPMADQYVPVDNIPEKIENYNNSYNQYQDEMKNLPETNYSSIDFENNQEEEKNDVFNINENLNDQDKLISVNDKIFNFDEEKVFTVQDDESKVQEPKKKAGRPRKLTSDEKPKRKVGRPKKSDEDDDFQSSKGKDSANGEDDQPKRRGRPKKQVDENAEPQPKKSRGRPKKADDSEQKADSEINDIDDYLAKIDNEIAKENALLEETKKELEKNVDQISSKKNEEEDEEF